MPDQTPILHLLCGKIASGKSTLAARLADAPDTLRLSEDTWLSALFSDQLKTGADYLRCSARLQAVLGPHVAALLKAGLSVVLDFPANTVAQRAWIRDVLGQTGAAHRMHLLEASDEVCLARLRARNADGSHDFEVSEALFHRFTAQFDPPGPEEGFEIVRHPQG